MDYEGYTFVFYKKKIIKMWYVLCFYFSTVDKCFLKCKLPMFALIKLKGSNFTPYYLP